MNYKKGKKIEKSGGLKTGELYFVNDELMTYIKKDRWLGYCFNKKTLTGGIIYEAIPDISREVYEEVFRQRNMYTRGVGLNSFDKEFLDQKFKPELPDDYTGWVKMKDDSFYMIFVKDGLMMYGFGAVTGRWIIDRKHTLSDVVLDIVPATPEEVYPRLKAEAEQRGLVEGVEVECLYSGIKKVKKISYRENITCKVRVVEGGFWVVSDCNNYFAQLLNSKGEWAKPIEKKEEKTFDKIQKDLKDIEKKYNVRIINIMFEE